jgi:flagellum-specific peptidoglycan hydrolase FlgJ
VVIGGMCLFNSSRGPQAPGDSAQSAPGAAEALYGASRRPSSAVRPAAPSPSPILNTDGADHVSQFVLQNSEAADIAAKALGVPQSAVLAKWALESGWGRSSLARDGHNLGGIKALRDWDGEVMEMNTREKDGTKVQRDPFRKYADTKEFAEDYVKFLGTKRYKDVPGAKDAYEFGLRLGRAGYHQDTPEKYASKLQSIERRVLAVRR